MHGVSHQGKVVSETTPFDQTCHWKEPINIFDFLHGDNRQRKIGSRSTSFGWVWPGVPLIKSGWMIL